MPCANCEGDVDPKQINPLDTCSNGFMSGCHNPCGHGPENTAACEVLPSQIENFTKQFFGEVVKTEVNGAVVWSLPCSLETGLPNNPRGATEPLACYFLRLFNDGLTLVGQTGPDGKPGAAGIPGHNAFTEVTHAFSQPTLNNPQIQIRTEFNPAILPGMLIFIDTSGWYRVVEASPDGVLFLTFLNPISVPAGQIVAGSLVLVAGAQGLSVPGVQGDRGQKGDPGDKGTKGDNGAAGQNGIPAPVSGVTNFNGMYHDDSGTLFNGPSNTTFSPVLFVSSNPTLTLPNIGKYLLTGSVALQRHTGLPAVYVRLFNVTQAIPVAGSTETNDSVNLRILPITAIHTTVAINEVIQLQSSGVQAQVNPLYTTLTYVQID